MGARVLVMSCQKLAYSKMSRVRELRTCFEEYTIEQLHIHFVKSVCVCGGGGGGGGCIISGH